MSWCGAIALGHMSAGGTLWEHLIHSLSRRHPTKLSSKPEQAILIWGPCHMGLSPGLWTFVPTKPQRGETPCTQSMTLPSWNPRTTLSP